MTSPGKLTWIFAPLTLSLIHICNATFSDLTFGLYLVVQKTAASGYGKTAPFLVSVPYLYACLLYTSRCV